MILSLAQGGGLLHSQDLSDFTDHIAKQNACQPFLNEQNAASWRSAATCTDCCNARQRSCQVALDDGIVRWLKEYIVASFIDMVCVVGPNQTVPNPLGQRNALHLVSTAIDSQAWHFQKFDNPPSAKQPPAKYAGYGCQATQFGDFPSLSLSLSRSLALSDLSLLARMPPNS